MGCNRCVLSFELTGKAALRYTPAGVPVIEGEGRHQSEQPGGLVPRIVDFLIQWMAVGALAETMDRLPLGSGVRGEGYLAASRRGGKMLRLCLETIAIESETERVVS